jgi:cellulose synthase/poly-beta-1,6-N-acetylglucosamine synthase-like glycosyltransferase
VPFFEVLPSEIHPAVVRLIPEDVERRRGILPLAVDNETALVAMLDPLDTVAQDEAASYLRRRVSVVLTTEHQFNDALELVYREDYLVHSANDLLMRSPEDSAFRVLSRGQKITMVVVILAVVAGLIVNYIATLSVLVSLAVVFYFAFSAYKLYLIYKALARSLEVVITPEQLATLDDRELPIYTVIVPLYKEPEVLPILVDALDRLEYPKTKLEVLLMLEEDDVGTIDTARHMRLPEGFQVLVVPNGEPKGKPKACNYGLLHATGEFIVLYDAEDVPEPDQLKKALLAFRLGGDQLVTVQAKLNYFNRDQNLLTRWFTSEYAMWFDLLLPGLDNSGAPIPLGGTSNHFRTEALRELGGWDPYNVTEDADLGIRLFKRGYRTVVVNSTTYEEANSNLYGWIKQRSRWIKGYMQTYLVHMRHPIQLWREVGVYPFLSIQLIIAGTFFAFLMNPVFWGLTILWFATSWGLIQRIFPGPIFYIGAVTLYLGNFAFVYINVAGALRREYHHLVKFTLLTPIYWMLMSVAAWKALYQLIFRPSYWEKTQHGLYQGRVRLPSRTDTRRAG